jgi:heat shock protein HslJ
MVKVILLATVAGIAGCTSTIAASGQPELMGAWTVEYIGERPVIDNSPAYIEFAEEGRAGGNASCNRFTGAYVLSGSSLSFSNMASTKKMCFPALMEQEARFLAALEWVAKRKCEMGCSICSMPMTAWYSRHHGGKNSTLIHDWTKVQ